MRPSRVKRIVDGAEQELEEVPMAIVGGFDVRHAQITFDYNSRLRRPMSTPRRRPVSAAVVFDQTSMSLRDRSPIADGGG
jgi:hypothetical protein